MDITLGLISGNDIPIPECQLIVHQPKIKEIGLIGEEDFFTGGQTLCFNKNSLMIEDKDKDVLSTLNNFQIFMMIMKKKETTDKKKAAKQLLTLLFPSYSYILTPKSLVFTKDKESILVDENNFPPFQETLKQILCLTKGDSQSFNPANEQAAQIAKKLMQGRQRVAAQKQQKEGSIFAQYLSVLSVGLHISISELTNLTVFQLYDLYERYQLFTSWDIDVRSRLAGAQADHPLENWMKSLH